MDKIIHYVKKAHIAWVCEHCGTKQFFKKPNTIYEEGECYKCGKTTKIKKNELWLFLGHLKVKQKESKYAGTCLVKPNIKGLDSWIITALIRTKNGVKPLLPFQREVRDYYIDHLPFDPFEEKKDG